MEFSQEQKLKSQTVPAVDVELSEEQLEIVAGGDKLKDFINDVIDLFTPKPNSL